jgi:hypothetical protein
MTVCANFICDNNVIHNEKYCRSCAQKGNVVGECLQCKELFHYYTTKINRKYCSTRCLQKFNYLKNREERLAYGRSKVKRKVYNILCDNCGVEFECYNKSRTYCTKKCSGQKNHARRCKTIRMNKGFIKPKLLVGYVSLPNDRVKHHYDLGNTDDFYEVNSVEKPIQNGV